MGAFAHKTKRMPYRKAWRRALERGGNPQAGELVAMAEARYQDLYAESVAAAHQALRQHMEKNILPGLSMYRALRSAGYAQDEAVTIVKDLFQVTMRASRRFFEFLGRTPLLYHLIRWTVRRFMRNSFPAEGFQVEWVAVDSDRVAFNMRTCFYVDTLNRYGASELVSVYCDLDDFIYSGVSKHVGWERTQTIGRGGEYCDFCFTRLRPESK